MAHDDGGPAFPVASDSEMSWGITKRDYFAAAALTGYLASYEGDQSHIGNEAKVAKSMYKLADAMLAQRKIEI